MYNVEPHICPPGSRMAWYINTLGLCPPPPGVWLLPACRPWFQMPAWPGLLLRMCPTHLGRSEEAQSRRGQADPALVQMFKQPLLA